MVSVVAPPVLRNSTEFVFEVAKAISSVLNLNTVIVDSQYNVIADSIDDAPRMRAIPENKLVGYTIRNGKSLFIDDATENSLCKGCPDIEDCKDKALITVPIYIDSEAVGAIILKAIDEQQLKQITENAENYKEFLTKIANTLALKVISESNLLRISNLEEYLKKVVNEVEHGIIQVDKQRKVRFFNDVANRYLNRVLYNGISIDEAIPEAKGMCISTRPFIFTRNSEKYSAKTKKMDHLGALLDIQKFEEIQWREKEVRKHLFAKSYSAKSRFEDIIGNSSKIVSAIRMAQRYANSEGTVLIIAETGVGKELFAQSIHNVSKRKDGPFVAVNCSAIPRDILESELFGYVGGAFTGASNKGKTGIFEQAHGGTIFLDEIGDMDATIQSSVLRVLQEKEIRRLGDNKHIPIDVRIIAATNKDLRQLVKRGSFREDLYYRLNILTLTIPPLRHRKGDIQLLADHFVKRYSREYDLNQINLMPKCLKILSLYSWPGNVRELENVMQRVVLLADGVDKFEEVVESIVDELTEDRSDEKQFSLKLDGAFKSLQTQIIKQMIESTSTKEEAAAKLGISSRTLYRRLQEVDEESLA